MALEFPIETGASKEEIFLVLRLEKDWTNPEILCSKTLIVVGNFYYNVLAEKKIKNLKD